MPLGRGRNASSLITRDVVGSSAGVNILGWIGCTLQRQHRLFVYERRALQLLVPFHCSCVNTLFNDVHRIATWVSALQE